MEYKKFSDSFYLRCDRDDDIIDCVLSLCKKEKILSATFSGIGCCLDVSLSVINPQTLKFEPYRKTGVLEMTSINGSISSDDSDNIFIHAHAMFSYKDHNNDYHSIGGHLLKATIAYTGEIVLNPVKDGVIRRQIDPKTGITVWKL